jgi:hypothetical protein
VNAEIGLVGIWEKLGRETFEVFEDLHLAASEV